MPFLFGALLCLFGIYLRRKAPESPLFTRLDTVERNPVRTAVRRHRWGLFFLPTYASLVAKFPLGTGLALNAIALVIFIGALPLIVIQAAGFAVLGYPMLAVLQHPTPARYLLVAVVGNLLLSLTYANVSALYCELFPTGIRTSGVGVAYDLAITVFGGRALDATNPGITPGRRRRPGGG
jgi:hypothetical protein